MAANSPTKPLAAATADVLRQLHVWLVPSYLIVDDSERLQWRAEDVTRVALATCVIPSVSCLCLIALYYRVDVALGTNRLPDVIMYRLGLSAFGLMLAVASRSSLFASLRWVRAPLGLYGLCVSVGMTVLMKHYPNAPAFMPPLVASIYAFALLDGPGATALYLSLLLMMQHGVMIGLGADELTLGSTEVIAFAAAVGVRSLQNEPRLFLMRRASEENERLKTLQLVAEGVAHDILNPLNFIPNATNRLRKVAASLAMMPPDDLQTGVLVRQSERLCEIILNATARGGEAIECFRRCARGDDPDEEAVWVDISSLARTVASIANIDGMIEDHLEAVKPCLVRKGGLHRVLLNLLINAQQACGPSGKVVLTTQDVSSGVVIKVHDNGSGVSPEYMKKIFEPYFTTKSSGTGMGLAVVKAFANSHKGWIKVENDSGALFTLFVPGNFLQGAANETRQ